MALKLEVAARDPSAHLYAAMRFCFPNQAISAVNFLNISCMYLAIGRLAQLQEALKRG